ncbi:MAG: hypothetical protein R3B13_03855 [Polyangiaceae bacterium]
MIGGPPLPGQQAGQAASARGAFRDALGSLRNLEQLLGSLRVGPRSVSTVLPAVHASIGIISRAAKQLLPMVADAAAASALEEFLTPRLKELDRALTSAIPKPMYAKNRLKLERTVTRLAAELDSARALLDALSQGLPPQPLRLDLGELMRGATHADKAAASSNRVGISALELPAGPCEAHVPPQLLQQLLGLAAALVVRGDSGVCARLRLVVDDNRCVIEVVRDPATSAVAWLTAPSVIAPTASCAAAIARLGGGSLQMLDPGTRVEMRWPR